jgi:hypothetical protein
MRFFRPLVAFSLTVSFAAVIGSGGSFLVASDASAASACGNAGTLSTSAGVSTCTYTAAGEDTFSVPAGVTQVSVVAIGGAGGAGGTYNAGIGGLGGSGADVSATVTGLSVSTLYVEVGSNGTDGTGGTANCTAGDGGTNGGGIGGQSRCYGGGGGGGGGASDVRTTPAAAENLTGASGDPRLVVAGGGGGGGGAYYTQGGAGGNAGNDTVIGAGAGGDCNATSGDNGLPGQPGGVGSGGGTGGSCSVSSTITQSVPGNYGQPSGGGAGASGDTFDITSGGGGGGGGYIGGGGGAIVGDTDGSGGGGGSSFGPAGTVVAISSASPSVAISWTSLVVSGVYFEGSSSSPTIVITGSGFGDESDLGTPLPPGSSGDNGNDYPNFVFSDTSTGVNVGAPGNYVGILISSYSDTEIVFTLNADYQTSVGQSRNYSTYNFVAGDGYSLNLLGVANVGTVAYYPTASISLPTGGGTYAFDASVPTTFSCSDFPGGEGVASCVDSNSSSTGTGWLNTGVVGNNTYTVTATSDEGFTGTASISYTVNPATPQITTSASPGILGGTLQDSATSSGLSAYNGTGSITFNLYGPADPTCGAAPVYTETVSNFSGSARTSTGYTASSAGTYHWVASFSGDSGDSAASTTCGDEPVVVSQDTTSLSTTPNVTTITLSAATPPVLTDTAVLSGGYSPTGTITFTLVNNGNTVDTETVAVVNGDGSYTTPKGYTLPATGTVTGTYQWNATYSGDANNASSADNNNANEQVVVKGRPESTTTSMNIAKGNVTYGAEAIQTINGVVTGQKNDGAPEGSVNVTYGPSATPLCSATLVAGTGDTSTYKCALTSNTQLNAFNYLTVRATFVPATVSSTSANFVYTTSMSGAFSGDNFLVKKDSTTTKVTVSPNSVTSGAESSAVFSVSVKTGNGETVPNGEIVTVKVGSTSCMVTLSAGAGTCFIANSALGVGTYSVSATYSGDTNLSNSSGSGPQLTVKRK